MDERQLMAVLKRTGNRQGWYGNTGKMVAAVSGGSDSVCMLWLLLRDKAGEDIIVAHVNHGIRDDAASRDADFVQSLAQAWDLQCATVTYDVPGQKRKGESLEEAGRRLRYGFLEECAERFGARWIAVGHTADDQVETVLHNVLRGCGIHGLAGIPQRRGKIVRPVIEMTRRELKELLKARGIPWMTDDTNVDTTYMRNRIRHELIPYLEASFNPKIREHLSGLAEDARTISDSRRAVASKLVPVVRTRIPCSVRSWARKSLATLEPGWALEILVEDCRRLGMKSLSRRRLKVLAGLLQKGGPWRFQWQDDIEMCGSSEHVMLLEKDWLSTEKPQSRELFFEGSAGSFSWGFWIFSWVHVSCSPSEPKGPWRVFIPDRQNHGCLLTDAASFMKDHSRLTAIPWCFRRQWPVFVAAPGGGWWTPAYDGQTIPGNTSPGIIIEAEPTLKGDIAHE